MFTVRVIVLAGFEYLNACAAQNVYETRFGPLELTWEQERLLLEGLLSEQQLEMARRQIDEGVFEI